MRKTFVAVIITAVLTLVGTLTYHGINYYIEKQNAESQEIRQRSEAFQAGFQHTAEEVHSTIDTLHNRRLVEEARPAARKTLDEARALLTESNKKVLKKSASRQELSHMIENAETVYEAENLQGINSIANALTGKMEAVTQDVAAWEAEQERLQREAEERERREAEERERQEAERRATEAERQRQAAAASNSVSASSPSGNSGSSGSTSKSSSSKSSSRSNNTSSGSSGGSLESRAREILSRHGCGGATIIWDDQSALRGFNGAADMVNTVYLNSRMPSDRFSYVVAHECVHLLQGRVWNHNYTQMDRDLNPIYGTSEETGAEHNADCVTQYWGYTKSNYGASCTGARMDAARAVASGNRP